jgi:hypothetical protein
MAGLTTRCNKTIMDGFHLRRCQRSATKMTSDGKGWCTQHHPDQVQAKVEARRAKMRETLRVQDEVSARAKELAAQLGVKGWASYHSGTTQQELVIPFTEVEKLIARIDATDNAVLELLPEPEV